MARRRNRNRLVVPEAAQGLERLKSYVMQKEGYAVNPNQPDDVKYEVAKTMGIPLIRGDNGHLRTEEAGKIGGQIGGSMVREMVRIAQQQLLEQRAASAAQQPTSAPPAFSSAYAGSGYRR